MKPYLFAVAFLIIGVSLLFGLALAVHGAGVAGQEFNSDVLNPPCQSALSIYGAQATAPLTYTIFLPFVSKAPVNWARNDSVSTTCEEEDNVNIPMFAYKVSRFQVKATHPAFPVTTNNCLSQWSGCGRALKPAADTCTKLYDDGTNVANGCIAPGYWRPYLMNIVVGSISGNYDYLVLSRKIADEASWPQYLVLYEDGNMRLKPQAAPGGFDPCFGSSVIVGSTTPSARPYTDIQSVVFNPSANSLDLTYRSGGTSHITLSVDRSQATAIVNINYSTSGKPFTTFRSMFVSDGHTDVDHIQAPSGDYPIMTGWTELEGPWWFFHRTIPSDHNTSAPDIRVDILN